MVEGKTIREIIGKLRKIKDPNEGMDECDKICRQYPQYKHIVSGFRYFFEAKMNEDYKNFDGSIQLFEKALKIFREEECGDGIKLCLNNINRLRKSLSLYSSYSKEKEELRKKIDRCDDEEVRRKLRNEQIEIAKNTKNISIKRTGGSMRLAEMKPGLNVYCISPKESMKKLLNVLMKVLSFMKKHTRSREECLKVKLG